MELLPVARNYEELSDKTRQFAAQRLLEMIESLRPHVAEILTESPLDLEPARIQANVALLKLHSNMIKELGLLYRVQDRPVQQQEETMPVAAVHKLLEEQEARMQELVAAEVEAAEMRGRLEAARVQELSTAQARDRLRGQLGQLGR